MMLVVPINMIHHRLHLFSSRVNKPDLAMYKTTAIMLPRNCIVHTMILKVL